MADDSPVITEADTADTADDRETRETPAPRKLTLRLVRGFVRELELDTTEAVFLEERRGLLEDAFYSEALYTLVRKWLSPPKARALFHAIVAHRDILEGRLGRNPGIQVAALDHLENIEDDRWDIGLVQTNALESLLHDSLRDHLTELYDQDTFLVTLEREIDRARRYHRHLALYILDVDDLDRVVERHGRVFGDYCLREMAGIMERAVRSTDIPCRYRDEQFSLLLPESTVQRAFLTAERVRRQVERNQFVMKGGQEPVTATVSAGVAEYPIHGRDALTLLESAESALQLAKETGKNRVCLPPRVFLGP